MIKLTTLSVVAMGMLSSISHAQSGLDIIYDGLNYDWDYYVQDGVNDISSTDIDDIRLFKIGSEYWMTIYADKYDANNAYTGIFKSQVSDGIDGIFAVARNSGYRWGTNKMLQGMEDHFGSKYFTYSPMADGTHGTWSYNFDFYSKSADWLENYKGNGFTFTDKEWSSGFSSTYTYNGGTKVTFNTIKGTVTGKNYVVDPDGTTHTINYNQTVYEDGASYGYISLGEIATMAGKLANELTEEAFEAGWDAGFDAGYNEGYENGFNDGYDAAISDLRN